MKKIVAIDDNPSVLLLLEKLIKINIPDAELFMAESGMVGIELAIEKQANVIILDILMPDPDGFKICELLKANKLTQDIPVVFLSAVENNRDNRIRAIESGADAFLSKPVDNLEMVLQIKTMFKINKANIKSRNEKQHLAEQIQKHSQKLEAELVRRKEVEKALVQSEHRYRFLVENQNDLVIQLNAKNELTFVNPNYCDSFGLTENDSLGKTFFSLIHEDDLESVKKSMESLEEPPYRSYHEYRLKTVNGWRWFGWSLKANLDKKNRIIDAVGVGRDITEQKKAEEKLLAQEYELRELNATKDKFFSIIAHDLKGPFNGIMGLSQMVHLMCEKKQYENLPHMAGLLRKSAEQSYDLLNNLLEWSRAQSGRKNIKPQLLNLCTSLTDTISLVSLSAHPKGLKIIHDCDEEIYVFADADVLNTIVRNLLGNAVKFSHPNNEIFISAVKRETDVLISVKDNGVGMDLSLQEKLFKIGEAIIKPGTNEEKGTGLGLILCKEFIEMHGGKIWLESELHKGTTFHFSLPLKK